MRDQPVKKTYLVKAFFFFIIASVLLSACSDSHIIQCHNCYSNPSKPNSHYICNNASYYKNKVIGDGHCVSLIKHCSGAPNTDQWTPGETVWKNNIEPGSIIATFKNGRYPNTTGYHAAIYIEQDLDGIWVWDQWQGKAVHKRLIRWRNDGAADANTAQAYRTVTIAN